MLGTLLAFITAVFRSLRRMGVRVPPEDEAAYLHLWSVIGYYLGIEAAGSITDTAGLGFGLAFALAGAMMLGGGVCLQHYAARAVMVHEGIAPWRYRSFLRCDGRPAAAAAKRERLPVYSPTAS
jgi:hypothetical protein